MIQNVMPKVIPLNAFQQGLMKNPQLRVVAIVVAACVVQRHLDTAITCWSSQCWHDADNQQWMYGLDPAVKPIDTLLLMP
jgi:hypothetical protein